MNSGTTTVDIEYDFVPPDETVVFEPTKEEFKDALAYIDKIRPIAEQYGICKIRPPEDWQPPFAVDVDKLRFTPRIQRLNELEAHTRIKLNYLDQVAKFWELQGSTLKIPLVERRALDLFTLKKYVLKEGGMEVVNSEKKWQKVANDMGYSSQNKNIGPLLKAHYERIIYPLDIFEREEQRKNEAIKKEEEEKQKIEEIEREYKPHNIPSRMGMKPPTDKDKAGRRSQRMQGTENGDLKSVDTNGIKKEELDDSTGSQEKTNEDAKNGDQKFTGANSFSKELARLQFFGAGPKMAGLPAKNKSEKTRGVKINFEYDPLAKYMCQTCGKGDAEEQMLLCDGCDDSYHTFCLMPPLAEIPKGDWRCPKCVAAEVSKPLEAFGFEQAQKEYTLQTFGEMADQFKSDYFNMPVHLIPTTLVEKEYWRILENIDEDVMIEYGADLHTMDHGSGFPQMTSKHLNKEDEQYALSDWNLNNLPVASNSILRCIDLDISGMKVPWLYVGMCFSTFCWHTEDHWTPSINYLHWGEPKTWYGIPGKYAEKAEEVMRQTAKELFSSQPDLLHHIVTTMNPNVLQAHGVPVYRTDQHAGEFIITWPRGYHAGFNQGYNLAEAVNFAPSDWLEMGRKCVEHYSLMRRYCVFCHDELVCNMATKAEKLTLTVAAATYKDLLTMMETEKKMRRQLLEAGVTEAEREAFELLPDDERQCAICKTTCFLSALASLENKDSDEIVCLRHFKSLECEPDKLILRYRYTLDELAQLLLGLKKRAESYDKWVDEVKEALEAKGDDRMELSDLKSKLEECEERKYPESELSVALSLTIEEAEKCQTVAHQLGNKKVRTRTRVVDAKYRLTVEELELFSNQLQTLPVKVQGHKAVEDLLKQVQEFKEDARKLLDRDISGKGWSESSNQSKKNEEKKNEADENAIEQFSKDISKCIEIGLNLDVDFEEMTELKIRQKQVDWLSEVEEFLDGEEPDLDKDGLDQLRDLLDSGKTLCSHASIESALGKISGLLTQAEKWEESAKQCLNAKPRLPLPDVEKLLQDGEVISSTLPTLQTLKEAVKKTKEWLQKSDEILKNPDNFPYLESVEKLVAKGRPLPIRLDALNQLETQVAQARAWRERTARVFLKKSNNSGGGGNNAAISSLLDVLAPRTDIGLSEKEIQAKRKKRGDKDDALNNSNNGGNALNIQHHIYQSLTVKDLSSPQTVVRAYKEAELKELQAIKEHRSKKEKNSKDENDDIDKTKDVNGENGILFECELCNRSFYPSHVPFPKPLQAAMSLKGPSNGDNGDQSSNLQNQAPQSLRDIKFLCPKCLRSRRPRLETILSLLVALNKLTVRLPEGEALQCLTERAMAWRDRAQKALDDSDVSEALKKLSEQNKQDSSPASASKSNKKGKSSKKVENGDDSEGASSAHETSVSGSESGIDAETLNKSSDDNSEKEKESDAKAYRPPEVKLSIKSSNTLEALMLEGDLLEVSMDETQHIWRVLQATEPRRSKRYPDLDRLEEQLENVREEKIKAKKKRKLEIAEAQKAKNLENESIEPKSKKAREDKGSPRKGHDGSSKKQQNRRKRKNSESSEQEEEQEDCSANPKCQRPTGKEVHWVQCDGCELWFHLHCIGLKPEQVSEDEDFICKTCKPNRQNQRKKKAND